jgi:glycerophosphoryl diester phosphodiesterase
MLHTESACPPATASWPYPRWIAHRGAGTLAPENTLAAFALGAAKGYGMFECDVKLSSDGVPFLLHDSTLERTTNGQGQAIKQSWHQLGQLDAGAWHSGTFAGEPLPTLAQTAAFCRQHGMAVNLELKPNPGQAHLTGQVVAQQVRTLWAGSSMWPLLSSFDADCLAAAQQTAPELPRALLLKSLDADWAATAQQLGCVAIVMHHPLWTVATLHQAQQHGWRTLSYTVNDAATAQRLLGLGLDGLITDCINAPWAAPTTPLTHPSS